MNQIQVDVASQALNLVSFRGVVIARYSISSGSNGLGEHLGSGCTPRGRHKIRIKLGSSCPENAVFVGRRPTGEIYDDQLARRYPERDWILTRILWLTGCEVGRNRGGQVDTLRRFIYLHGCPETEPVGIPRSHGCIRMRNRDILTLFERVESGAPVLIE